MCNNIILGSNGTPSESIRQCLSTRDLMNYTAHLYATATRVAPSVDVSILQRYKPSTIRLSTPVEILLLDRVNTEELERTVKEVYNITDAKVHEIYYS